MQSLLQAKHRQTSIIKCFRYNLYITGSHFGERYTNIAKMEGGGVIDKEAANPTVSTQTQRAPPPCRALTLVLGINCKMDSQSCGFRLEKKGLSQAQELSEGGLSEGIFCWGCVVVSLASLRKASWISYN